MDVLSVNHAWSWFELHAAQRLQMLNFWLISIAFLVAAYVAALDKHRPLACVIAAFGACLTLCFHRLERRTRELVRLAEGALSRFQSCMAQSTGVNEMRILELAAPNRRRMFSTYGRVILVMQYLVLLAFVAAGVYAASTS
jgi:uncharacterized membrane protein YedE/YeeE